MIYVSDTPYDIDGTQLFHLWADDPEGAHPALWSLGVDPATVRRDDQNGWEVYKITGEQFADLVMVGVTITDKYGPAEWCAKRDNRQLILAMIAEARARGLV